MNNIKYTVISPDGIAIELCSHNSEEEAWKAFDKWAQRFNKQEYYSSNEGRIPIHLLKSRCTIREITIEKEYNYLFRIKGDKVLYSFQGSEQAFKDAYPDCITFKREQKAIWDENLKRYIS